MPKSDYVNNADDAFSAQLQTAKTNLPSYSALLDLSAGQVTAQAADADRFAYELACQKIMQNGAQQWTTWKNLTRGGGSPPPAGAPVLPVFPAAVPAVAPGVEARFRALVKQIKAHANYNEAIGQALGIEGAQQTGPDLSAVQPKITLVLSGGMVTIQWGWQGYSAYLDLLEIQVDRGDGKGYALLAYDSTPNYNDTYTQPAAPVKWKYKAIFRVGDARVGQWSDEVALTVGG